MIERYTRKEMAKIWEAENRFRIWLEIETLACEMQAELGVIPHEAVKTIREKGNFDIARIDAIEAETELLRNDAKRSVEKAVGCVSAMLA